MDKQAFGFALVIGISIATLILVARIYYQLDWMAKDIAYNGMMIGSVEDMLKGKK